MGKKLSNIEKEIRSKEENFFRYLREALEGELFDFIETLAERTKVYVFSGIIRNYFLHNYLVRDVDLVVESDDEIQMLLNDVDYRINSFGGFKIQIGRKNVDLWRIDKTWALNHQQLVLDLDLEKFIPSTAFFNFSAVVYSINERRFIYKKEFLSFLSTKTIDYVYAPNANESLCVVNTLYYSDKYHLKIGNKLQKLIVDWHKSSDKNYEDVQLKHFGKIIYPNDLIDSRLYELEVN